MKRYLPSILIVGLIILFRLIGSALPESQPNFQPLVALFFCGAFLAPNWRGFAIPFGIWASTYFLDYGQSFSLSLFLTTLFALTVMFFMGQVVAKRGIPSILVGSLVASLSFHLITCGAAWLADPIYQKSLTGLMQSVWSGPVGSPHPSWLFLRNLAAANLLFTAIFVCAQVRLPQLSLSLREPLATK